MKTADQVRAEIKKLEALAQKYPDDQALQVGVEVRVYTLGWVVDFEGSGNKELP